MTTLEQPVDTPADHIANDVTLAAYVHLGYGFGAGQCRLRFAAGLAPDATPYGLHHAESMNCSVTHSFDHPESTFAALHRKAWNRLLGFDVVHAFRNRAAIQAAQVLWTMEERQYLAILFLGCFMPRIASKKLIAQTVWLFDSWFARSKPHKWFLGKLLKRAAALTVHSKNYLHLPELRDFHHQMRLLPFGISLDSFPLSTPEPQRHTPLRILAMGSDRTRDWPTFLAAFGNDERFEVIAISPQLGPAIEAEFGNVRTWQNPTMEDFRWCYRWADLVVIPMVPNLYSGITVALEATSMGVPVLSSQTGGVDTYFTPQEVTYVPPTNPKALAQAALGCTKESATKQVAKARQRFHQEQYSTKGLAARYVTLSHELIITGS